MKIEINLDNNHVFGITDAIFVALLKEQRKDALEANVWHEDDVKLNKKTIKACNVLLNNYGEE